MKIVIEVNQFNSVEINKANLTQDDVIKLMNIMGLKCHKEDVSEPEHIQELSPWIKFEKADIEVDKVKKAEKKRSRQLPLSNSSDSEGFSIRESFRVLGDAEIQAEIKCPNCKSVTTKHVPKFFNHMSCDECDTKVYIKSVVWNDTNATDSKGNQKTGDRKYFSAEERREHRESASNELNDDKNDDEILEQFNADVLQSELESYTVGRMRAALSLHGYTNYSGLIKSDLIKFIIENGGFIDHDDEGSIKFKK